MLRRWIAIVGCMAVILGALLAGLQGCGRRLTSSFAPNQPPELELLEARADRGDPTSVRVRWAARDPDGTVARSCWTLAPVRSGQVGAQVHSSNGRECVIPRAGASATRAAGTSRPEPDLLTLWAVDNLGEESKRVAIALFGANIAPTVQLTCPSASPLYELNTTTEVQFSWSGSDPDGIFTQLPVKYRYKLLSDNDSPMTIDYAKAHPDSLRSYYAERAWAGWDSTTAGTTTASFTRLELNRRYLFVVTGFDEMGDYDPQFSFSKNMLIIQPGFAAQLGPRLSASTPYWTYTQVSGGWSTDPATVARVEVPAGAPVRFNVSGQAVSNGPMTGFRWMLDGDPHDQAPRSGPADLRHWSDWGLYSTVEPGTFAPGRKRQEHMLYIEGRGVPPGCSGSYPTQLTSLLMVQFAVVTPTNSRELLIVDDTRREVDQYFTNGALRPYTAQWPSATELDTFLYARGNVPWRSTVNPTSGVISPPGLFAGYSFDTIGTRGLLSGMVLDPNFYASPNGTIPLSVLADYRHVIWMTDYYGATYLNAPYSTVNPMSALRYMSTTGRESVLGAYVAMGGKVWLLGGRSAYASLINFNATGTRNNDAIYGPGMAVFSSAGPAYELVPGRLIFDAAHIQSELVMGPPGLSATRTLGRFDGNPGAYATLPAALTSKTSITDPLPPTRPANHGVLFFQTTHYVEFLTQPNYIQEDVIGDWQSVLDTLYRVSGTGFPSTGYLPVAMTSYHGAQNAQFIWSGLDIWSWQRSQCMGLVDGVLQGVWGMQREPVAREPLGASAVARIPSLPGAPRLTPHLPVARER